MTRARNSSWGPPFPQPEHHLTPLTQWFLWGTEKAGTPEMELEVLLIA